MNASLGYLAVTPLALGNHGNRVNLQQWNYIILWQSQETERGRGREGREMQGAWGEGGGKMQ